MIACHECDLLHVYQPLKDGARACCRRCHSTLYRHVPHAIDRALAFSLAALICFLLANVFPFLSLEFSGRVEDNVLISGAFALYHLGMGELGLVVFLTSILFPLLVMIGLIAILLPLKFNIHPAYLPVIYRVVRSLEQWSMLAVFMLGILIAYVKLQDMATVIPGVSLFLFVATLLFYSAAITHFTPQLIWPHVDREDRRLAGRSAKSAGLLACHTCHLLIAKQQAATGRCPRCASSLHPRKHDSFTRTWALIWTAGLLLIPANYYPVMTVISFGQGEPSTIIGGIVHLMDAGMWGLGFIVLFASIVVPISKLGALVLLLRTTQHGSAWRPRDRTRLYRITEVVGAWSMVDIYVVAILAALVNLDALATIEPGIGAIFFAAAVVVTMLAAQSFDPRLIWDALPPRQEHGVCSDVR